MNPSRFHPPPPPSARRLRWLAAYGAIALILAWPPAPVRGAEAETPVAPPPAVDAPAIVPPLVPAPAPDGPDADLVPTPGMPAPLPSTVRRAAPPPSAAVAVPADAQVPDIDTPQTAAQAPSVARLHEQVRRMILRKEWPQALAAVETALAVDPAYLPLWRQKAEIHVALNHILAADDAYKVLLIDPSDEVDRSALALAALDNLFRAPSDLDFADLSARLAERIRQAGPPTFGEWLAAKSARPDFAEWLPAWLDAWRASGIGLDAPRQLLEDIILGRRSPDSAYNPAELNRLPGRFAGFLCYLGGRARAQAGEDAPALVLLDRAEAYGHPRGDVAHWRGWVHRRHNRPSLAADAWTPHWRETERPERILFDIVTIRMDEGDNLAADEMLRQALAVFPRSPAFQAYRMLVLTRMEDWEAAKRLDADLAGTDDGALGRAFGRALVARARQRPADVQAQLEYAAAHIERRFGELVSPETVEDWLLSGLRENVGDATGQRVGILRNAGWTHWINHDYAAALRAWESALAIDVHDRGRFALTIFAQMLDDQRRDDALELIRRHFPGLTSFDLAIQLIDQNRRQAAIVALGPLAPAGAEAAWVALYQALLAVDDPDREVFPAAIRRLAPFVGPALPLARRVLENDGSVRPSPLPPSVWAARLAETTAALVRYDLRDLYPLVLSSPAWRSLPPESRRDVLGTIGLTLARSGQPAEARPYLEALLESAADDPRGHLGMALVERAADNVDAVRRHAEAGLASAPPNGEDWAQLAAELARLDGDASREIDMLRRYIALRAEDEAARGRLIDRLIDLGRHDEARAELDWFEKRHAAGDRFAASFMATAYQRLGRLMEAEKLWASMADEAPDVTWRLSGLGDSLNRLGRPAETLERLAPLARQTGDPLLCALLGEAATMLGRPREALFWVERGLEARPAELRLLQMAAQAAESLGEDEAADRYARRYLAERPDDVAMIELRIRAMMAAKRWKEADALNRPMLAANPRQRSALERAIEIARELKAPPEAIWALEGRRLRFFGDDDPGARVAVYRAAIDVNQYEFSMQGLASVAYRDADAPAFTLHLPAASAESGLPPDRVVAYLQAFGGHAFPTGLDAFSPGRGARNVAARSGLVPMAVLVGNPEPAALAALDAYLASIGGRAAVLVDAPMLALSSSGADGTVARVDAAALAALADSGRWDFLLTDASRRRVPVDAAGREGPFWLSRRWLGDRLERPPEMLARLREDIARLRQRAVDAGLNPVAWYHPEGDYGQRLLRVDDEAIACYVQAVTEIFPLAFAAGGSGYWLPGEPTWRVTARTLAAGAIEPAAFVSEALWRHPTRSALYELARVASWDGQTPRARKLFAYAEAAGLDPERMAQARANNALFSDDPPHAADYAYAADAWLASRGPDASDRERENMQRTWDELDLRLEPMLYVRPWYYTDSNDEEGGEVFIGGEWQADPRWRAFAEAGVHRWQDGEGRIEGVSLGGGARYHAWEGRWLDLSARVIAPDGDAGVFGTLSARWHGDYAVDTLDANGVYDITFAYEAINTRQAILDGTRAFRLQFDTEARLRDRLSVEFGLYGIHRTDSNTTVGMRLRPMWQLTRKPRWSVGYWFTAASSDENPDAYYAPVDHQAHQAVLAFQHEWERKLTLNALAAVGVSRSSGVDWGMAYRGVVGFNWRVTRALNVGANFTRLELPDYSMSSYSAEVGFRF